VYVGVAAVLIIVYVYTSIEDALPDAGAVPPEYLGVTTEPSILNAV
jgi:hypothetical protein